jgi:hypothetical protein
MVMLLGSLAHNLIVWSRRWLTAEAPRLAGYGALRMVRDLFQVAGLLGFDPQGQLTSIILNRAAPLARELAAALGQLLGPIKVKIKVGAI